MELWLFRVLFAVSSQGMRGLAFFWSFGGRVPDVRFSGSGSLSLFCVFDMSWTVFV